MPYEVHISEPTRTIVITGTGSATTADTLRIIAEQKQTFRDYAGFNLMYDSSQLNIESSPGDMIQVAKALFEESNTAFGRVALVVPERREWLGRIFTALAHPHGVNANVFTHRADALKWLGISDPLAG